MSGPQRAETHRVARRFTTNGWPHVDGRIGHAATDHATQARGITDIDLERGIAVVQRAFRARIDKQLGLLVVPGSDPCGQLAARHTQCRSPTGLDIRIDSNRAGRCVAEIEPIIGGLTKASPDGLAAVFLKYQSRCRAGDGVLRVNERLGGGSRLRSCPAPESDHCAQGKDCFFHP